MTLFPYTTLFRSMATGPYRSALLSTPAQRPTIQPTQPFVSRATLIHRRVQEIRARSTATNPVCLKCGSTGHVIQQCRNAQLCFICNKLGHKGKFCKTFRPPVPKRRENPRQNPRNSDLQFSRPQATNLPPLKSSVTVLHRPRADHTVPRSGSAQTTPMA